MKLFLVRHGETEENVVGILLGHHHGTLTELGKQQAKEAANKLKNYNFSHIYSSDLNRCVDTTEYIKEFHADTPLTFTKELRERNLGVFQGKSKKLVDWDILPGDEIHKKPENGESMFELKVRVLDFIKELYNQYPHDIILLISHNGWIKQVISHITGVSSVDITNVSNTQIIEVEIHEDLTGKIM